MPPFAEPGVSPDAVPERSPGVAWQVVDGEMVLLRVAASELLGLNVSARRIWELCDGTRPVSEIGRALGSEFGLPPETAKLEVSGFLAELERLGAVTWK